MQHCHDLRIWEMYIMHLNGCVKTFTCIGIPRNTDDSLVSGTKLLLPSWLSGFRHEKRETHNFCYADCSSSVNSELTEPTNARTPRSKQLDSSKSKSQLNPQPIASGHDVIHITSPISYPEFYYDICDCHILPVNTCVNVCTYPCTKLNGSQPN